MTRDQLAQFGAYQRAKGLSERTIENRDYMLRALLAAAGKTDLLTVTLQDMRAHLGRGVKAGSMQTERDCYRAFFAYAKDDGLLKGKNPTKKLVKIKRMRGRPRPYTQEQIDAMLTSGAYRRTRAMILLACYQGFRASEVAAVHGRDFDLTANTLSVRGKGGKDSTLPLHPIIRELALTMPRNAYWFPARKRNYRMTADGGTLVMFDHIHSRSVSDLMRKAKERAGITERKLTGHSLRHAFGTDLVAGGADLRTVQELLRHESLATTQIYTGITSKQMADGVAVLPMRELPAHSGRRAA